MNIASYKVQAKVKGISYNSYDKKNYKIAVRECQEGDIIEIDTFNELKAIDSVYDV